MEKRLTLKDGTNVFIRDLVPEDLDRLMEFYQALPEEDRRFLQIDVTKRDVVKKRIELMMAGLLIRIVALEDKKNSIIADGALELPSKDWRRNQAEMRVIVARPFQRMGLGMLMMKELTQIAHDHKVELLVVKMMRPQIAARKICRKLGFRKKHVIHDYVVDMYGKTHGLLVMTQNVHDMWEELNHLYDDSDWQRCR